MKENVTSGKCRLCGRVFGRRQMTNHLKSCWTAHLPASPRKPANAWLHLVVEGRYSPHYWLHLQAPRNSTFDNLDSVLRSIWLECCDHLSSFEFPVKRPRPVGGSPFDRALLAMIAQARSDPRGAFEDEDALTDETLGGKLQPGVAFGYQYDFGSTTKLKLRVAGNYPAAAIEGRIKVLARNEPVSAACTRCQKPATRWCPDCRADYCDVCAKKHPCGSDLLLPRVNSPRMGVCAYSGPSIEP